MAKTETSFEDAIRNLVGDQEIVAFTIEDPLTQKIMEQWTIINNINGLHRKLVPPIAVTVTSQPPELTLESSSFSLRVRAGHPTEFFTRSTEDKWQPYDQYRRWVELNGAKRDYAIELAAIVQPYKPA